MKNNEYTHCRLNRRTFLVGAAAMAGSILLTACEAGQSSTISSGANKYKIAFVVGSKIDPFYATMAKSAQERANELGVNLLHDGPAMFDPTLQIPIVAKMIAQKVDAIIIAACDKTTLIKPLQQAHQAGIMVISVDTFIGNGNYVNGPVTFPLSYIGSDNIEGGRIAGEALIKSIGGSGKLYIQNTSPGASTSEQRVKGCKDAIDATNGAVTLVGVDYNYHDITKANNETFATLERVDDLAGIFGTNVASGEGAALGVKRAFKQGVVKIANFDAPENAITDLRNGVIDLLIAQKPGEMGSIAVEYAMNALSGNTNGIQKRVPTGFLIIDQNNIDTPEVQAAIYRSS